MRRDILNKHNLRICDEIFVEEDHINVTFELWFDVDKYFGTNIRNDADTWINFYVDVYSPDKIKSFYVISSNTEDKDVSWTLTDNEKALILEIIEDKIREDKDLELLKYIRKE